ncbi:MAG: pilus assembly protein TadG-related protein [Cyanobacteriota/Melainabacteria group bacterium]
MSEESQESELYVSAVLMIVLVLVVVISAAFSFDYGNGLVVKENLQNATDAGALAGR